MFDRRLRPDTGTAKGSWLASGRGSTLLDETKVSWSWQWQPKLETETELPAETESVVDYRCKCHAIACLHADDAREWLTSLRDWGAGAQACQRVEHGAAAERQLTRMRLAH
jgi:hypothetical protein